MKQIITTAIALVAAYAGLLALIYLAQDRLVYFPLRELDATPRALGLDYQDVWITTEDGVRVHGWFVPITGAKLTVLHLHGNGGNISHRLERIRQFRDLGVNAFLIDYRGYGKSEGSPSEEGTHRDARAAWRYLTETRNYASARIVLHGESLGGAVATKLATEQPPGALIIESSFTSIKDVGAELYPWLPVRWISKYRYATLDHLARVRAPVLIIHSRDDEIIPFHHGRSLYDAAPSPKHFVEIRGDHNAGSMLSADVYLPALRDFLRRIGER